MKTLVQFIRESNSQFDKNVNVSVRQFDKWKKDNEDKLDIVYSQADKLYAVYELEDKANPKWKGVHIGTYNCLTGDLYYDDDKYFKSLL